MNTLQALRLIKKRFFLLKAYTVAVLALAVLCFYWLYLFFQYADLHASLASGALPVSAEPERLVTALDVPYFSASRLFFCRFCADQPFAGSLPVRRPFPRQNPGRGRHIPYSGQNRHLALPACGQPCSPLSCLAGSLAGEPKPGAVADRAALHPCFLWWALFLAALAFFSLFVFRTLQLERASSMALFIQLPRFVWLGAGSTLLILLESLLALHLMRRMRTGWALSAAKGDFPLYNGNE